MKKFLEFQLQNQVVVPNNQHNVFNFSKIKPLLEEIKSRYYNGDFGNVVIRSYTPESGFLKSLANDYNIPHSEVISIFCDEKYAGLSQRSEVDSVDYNNVEFLKIYNKLCIFLATGLGLELDGLNIRIHVQKPGQFHALHIDYVKTKLSKNAKITDDPDHTKFLIFFDDWQEGQAFQINQDFLKWKSCDVLNYNIRDSQHGSANFGYEDRFLMVVTGRYKNGIKKIFA